MAVRRDTETSHAQVSTCACVCVCVRVCMYHRSLDVTTMTLHFNGVGSHSRIFEAMGSMLSRNALNPADVSTVSTLPVGMLINYY